MIVGLEVLQSAVEVGTKSLQNVRKYGGPQPYCHPRAESGPVPQDLSMSERMWNLENLMGKMAGNHGEVCPPRQNLPPVNTASRPHKMGLVQLPLRRQHLRRQCLARSHHLQKKRLLTSRRNWISPPWQPTLTSIQKRATAHANMALRCGRRRRIK